VSSSGTAIVDFGATTNSGCSLVVAGQAGIVAGSLVEAWISPVATVDHTADEHLVEDLHVYAGTIVPGASFTIFLMARDLNGAYGKWTINWVWV
jgi:hypothetical protein